MKRQRRNPPWKKIGRKLEDELRMRFGDEMVEKSLEDGRQAAEAELDDLPFLLPDELEELRRQRAVWHQQQRRTAAAFAYNRELDKLVSERERFIDLLRLPDEDCDWMTLRASAGHLLSIRSRMRALLDESDPSSEERATFDELLEKIDWESVEKLYRDIGSDLRESRRRALLKKPSPAPAISKVLCRRCQKKEARLEGFCKKCARIEGIIVHGKIT